MPFRRGANPLRNTRDPAGRVGCGGACDDRRVISFRVISFRVISFIVPAHDEARMIAATLRSIDAAATTLQLQHEVIVVDDASTDGTGAIARQAGATVVRIEARHIAAARNAGARASTGEALFFIDADTCVDARAVASALAALGNGAAGGGAAVRLSGRQRLHMRLLLAGLMRVFRWTRIAPGCFLFCQREAYVAVGGFDERYYAGEDVAMSRALARRGRFVILREPVWTSDRKLRTFTVTDHLRLAWRFLFNGRRILHSRDALALWYARRRHGPE